MKKQIFVIVPYYVPPTKIDELVEALLKRHRIDDDNQIIPQHGRYDYLVGSLSKSLNDPLTEGRLPPRVRRTFSGNICDSTNLSADIIPAVLVTPDGEWHDSADFGPAWEAHYRELIEAQSECWVVEVWAHS